MNTEEGNPNPLDKNIYYKPKSYDKGKNELILHDLNIFLLIDLIINTEEICESENRIISDLNDFDFEKDKFFSMV